MNFRWGNFRKEKILSLVLSFIVSVTTCLILSVDVAVAAAVDSNRELTPSDIPDPVLFQKFIELGDANHNGKLTIIELESYTGDVNGFLDLRNLNITNITGVGYAKGVKSIDLSNNNFTSIPNQTFMDCRNLTSIQLPDEVTSIGDSAFEGCNILSSINALEHVNYLPKELTKIGEKCFLECEQLANINLPMKITTIGNSAFSRSGLTSIVIPKPKIALGVSAFNGCTQLTQVTLPEGMDTIPMECFKATEKLVSIVLPISIETLEEGAFSLSGLSGFVDLSAYAKLVSIKTSAFSGTPLSEVILPDNLTELGERAFENCFFLKEITIPSGISVINKLTFSKCISLENVIFVSQKESPNNYILQEIMSKAFYGCTGLREVQFLKNLNNLTTLGNQAFAYCSAEVKLNNKAVKDEYGQQVYYGIQSILLPGNLVELGEEAFSNCNSLQTMTIPNKVTVLQEKTFLNCNHLTNITLSDILTSIGANCFENCQSLNNIVFPASLTQIGNNAFLDCANEKVKYETIDKKKVYDYTYTGISNIVLPDSVNQIGDSAFEGCFNLEHVKLPLNLNQLNNALFEGCAIQSKGSDGKAIPDSYRGLKTVTLPNNLVSIGNTVFKNCYAFDLANGNLCNAIDSTSLITIGKNAFENCYNLTSVIIPKNLESIGSSAFLYCTLLEKVDFRYAMNLKTIGSSAFKGAAIKGIVRLPDGITKVESSVFQACKNITSVEFPDGLISIGSLSFSGCSNLTAITIPAAATIVYDGTKTSFNECGVFTNAMIKAVPPDSSLMENAQAVLPVKCFNEIISATVENENVVTAQITTDSKSKPQVTLSGVKEGLTKVLLKGTIQYEAGKDPKSGDTLINMFQTSVEFNVVVSAIKCTDVKFEQPIRGLTLRNTTGITLTPTITPADTSDLKIWTSDNESVAKVNEFGLVTPVSYGTAMITLKVGDRPEVQCQINVCAPASSISLDKTSLTTLLKGDTTTLNVTVNYASAYTEIKSSYPEVIFWTSSNDKVATVDQNGNVSIIGNGETEITAKADAAGRTKACKITVMPEETDVSFDNNNITLLKGDTAQIKVTLNPADSPISKVEIISSDSKVVTVSVNDNVITVTAKTGGTAKITATPVKGNAATCLITVNSPLTSLTATPMEMKIGESRTISLVKTPDDATDSLVYQSDNPKVATVDAKGKVTVVGAGSTKIWIKSTSGSTEAYCGINENGIPGDVVNMPEKLNVESNKVWQVLFNYPVDLATSSIYVVEDSLGNVPLTGILVQVDSNDKRLITVAPSQSGWQPRMTYYLVIKRGMKSADHRTLLKEYRMKFSIKRAS